MPFFNTFFLTLITFSVSSTLVLGDPLDWVGVNYVLQQAKATAGERSVTADAQTSIVRGAGITARDGPWTVTNAKVAVAPSRDPHDYLSWAPYHWPDCNWCSNGRKHIAQSSSTDNSTATDPAYDSPDSSDESKGSTNPGISIPFLDSDKSVPSPFDDSVFPQEVQVPISIDFGPSETVSTTASSSIAKVPTETETTSNIASTSPADKVASGTPTPARAAAKTQKPSCTPSPTKSLAPSATWTTCPYVVRDGQANPDVRTLNGPGAITGVSQSVLYNAIAFALQKSAEASKNIAHFVDVFFLDPSTKMNPNMDYGQIVRGPGKSGQQGTFTGVLDLRGMVKIANAIRIVKGAQSPDWTAARDRGMLDWTNAYVNWLVNSSIGKSLASKANNHLSFYISQLAACRILQGNTAEASRALQNFFAKGFADQIASSGEQPFEAVRTRPFHYRCFNLEALITNAKLGDELGLDLWSVKSRYGATIQTAVNFAMSVNPKGEDVTEILPHVAAIAAAYGDPTGKYANFLKKTLPEYKSKPFYFYDQKSAFSKSPASRVGKRSTIWSREDADTEPGHFDEIKNFVCPSVFDIAPEVELEDGLFVTCEELKPLY